MTNNFKEKVLKEFEKEVESRIDYDKKYRLNGDYRNGFSKLESGNCCEKCDLTKLKKVGNMVALAGCKDPFQIECKCHIPFRKVSVNTRISDLEEIKSILEKYK